LRLDQKEMPDKLRGKLAHVAEHQNGISPAYAISQIINVLMSLNNKQNE
jgi:metal-dependent amidase/aminoacylase/carboxypeptidase family protein